MDEELKTDLPDDKMNSSSSPRNDPHKYPEHLPNLEGEVLPTFIPRGVRDIILDYLVEDKNNTIKPVEEKAIKNRGTAKLYDHFKLLGRNLSFFIRTDTLAELKKAANNILLGDEKNVTQAIDLIKKNPLLLHIPTEGVRLDIPKVREIRLDIDSNNVTPCGYNRVKRKLIEIPTIVGRENQLDMDSSNVTHCGCKRVKGKLIEIAAIAGDVNLRSGIKNTMDIGLVERLAKAGELSDEEVREQLEVITGKKAKEANEQRNQLIISATDRFMESILKIKSATDFNDLMRKCRPDLRRLDADLFSVTSQTITMGFLFDPRVISIIAKKFESKINRFGGWHSIHTGVFRVCVYGLLQKHLAARDAQIVQAGMSKFIEKNQIPLRKPIVSSVLLRKDHLLSKLTNVSLALLGEDYYLDYDGNFSTAEECELIAPTDTQDMRMFDLLAAKKTEGIEKLHEYRRIKP